MKDLKAEVLELKTLVAGANSAGENVDPVELMRRLLDIESAADETLDSNKYWYEQFQVLHKRFSGLVNGLKSFVDLTA